MLGLKHKIYDTPAHVEKEFLTSDSNCASYKNLGQVSRAKLTDRRKKETCALRRIPSLMLARAKQSFALLDSLSRGG